MATKEITRQCYREFMGMDDDQSLQHLPSYDVLARRGNRLRQQTRPNHPKNLDYSADTRYLYGFEHKVCLMENKVTHEIQYFKILDHEYSFKAIFQGQNYTYTNQVKFCFYMKCINLYASIIFQCRIINDLNNDLIIMSSVWM